MIDLEELEILLLEPGSELESHSDDIWMLLTKADKEFYPSLSSRSDTTEHELSQEVLWGGPIAFFETVMQERVFLALLGRRVVGILSFIAHYEEDMLAQWSPSTYASTAIVLPSFRRQGIGSRLNDALESLPNDLRSPWITRRTWSANAANLGLLKGRGFEEVVRLRDHRGPGVDTIYLARRTTL